MGDFSEIGLALALRGGISGAAIDNQKYVDDLHSVLRNGRTPVAMLTKSGAMAINTCLPLPSRGYVAQQRALKEIDDSVFSPLYSVLTAIDRTSGLATALVNDVSTRPAFHSAKQEIFSVARSGKEEVSRLDPAGSVPSQAIPGHVPVPHSISTYRPSASFDRAELTSVAIAFGERQSRSSVSGQLVAGSSPYSTSSETASTPSFADHALRLTAMSSLPGSNQVANIHDADPMSFVAGLILSSGQNSTSIAPTGQGSIGQWIVRSTRTRDRYDGMRGPGFPSRNGDTMPSNLSKPGGKDRDAPASQQIRGDVFLDGAVVGRWMSRFLSHEAERGASGRTGFDVRRGRLLPGPAVGGHELSNSRRLDV